MWHNLVIDAIALTVSSELDRAKEEQRQKDNEQKNEEEPEGQEGGDGLAPSTEATERKKKIGRLNKTLNWLKDPLTHPRLVLAATCMKAALSLLMTFFERARMGLQSGLLDFVSETTSPAHKVIHIFLLLLQDPEHSGWLPLIGTAGWTPNLLHAASIMMLTFIGNIWLRLVEPFEEWPLKLGVLVHPDSSPEEKDIVCNAFYESHDCCYTPSDGVSGLLRRRLTCAADLMKGLVYQFLVDFFAQVPVSTTLVEAGSILNIECRYPQPIATLGATCSPNHTYSYASYLCMLIV